MKIRKTIISIWLAMVMVLTLLFGSIIQFIVMPQYERMEKEDMDNELESLENIIASDYDSIASTCRDWASWDDMYEFSFDNNESFIGENLNGLESYLNMDLFTIVDAKGTRLYDRYTGPGSVGSVLTQANVRFQLDRFISSVQNGSDRRPFHGAIQTTLGTFIFVEYPIMRSDSTGPENGMVIMGRVMDGPFMGSFRNKTGLDFFEVNAQRKGREDFYACTRDKIPFIIDVAGHSRYSRSQFIEISLGGVHGAQDALFSAEVERTIYSEGWRMSFLLGLGFFIPLAIMLTLVILVLDKLIIRRIVDVGDQVRDMSVDPDPKARLHGKGTDEISELVGNINGFLASKQLAYSIVDESDKRFNQMFHNSPSLFIDLSLDGTVLDANDSFLRAIGRTRESIVGIGFEVFLIEPESQELLKIIDRSIEGGIKMRFDGLLRRSIGPSMVASISLVSTRVAGRTIIHMMMEDISARKQTEIELARAHQEALAASQLKSDFISNVSHEIRTPMNGVLGMIDLLERSDLGPIQRKYVEKARSSGRTMLSIVNDILDMSKIEIGKMTLEKNGYDIRNTVDNVCGVMEILALEKGLVMTHHIADDVPERVIGDELRVTQVLNNILSNAVKFTGSGSVGLKVSTIPDKGVPKILFSVNDTGIGMSEETLMKLFQKFTQADSTTSRKYGGTGLGLAISKELVERMGGNIWAESELGKGTTFRFTVEMAIDERPTASDCNGPTEVRPDGRIRGIDVLVVEDDDTNLFLTRQMLEEMGAIVTEARNGSEALERVRGKVFSLVLMDLHMPVMDGFEAAKRIRTSEDGSGRRTPIIALTGSRMEDERNRILESGMDDHLMKPFDIERLRAAIQGIITIDSFPMKDRVSDIPPPIDIGALMAKVGGREDYAEKTLRIFYKDYMVVLRELGSMIDEGEGERASLIVHRIKGTARTIAAHRTADAAESIDRAFKSNDLEKAAQGLHGLKAELEACLEWIADRYPEPCN